MTRHVAVVTGGSRGLGRACAVALAGSGWTVAIGYRSSETAAKETAAALEASRRVLAWRLAATRDSRVTRAVLDAAGRAAAARHAAHISFGMTDFHPLRA